MRRLPKLDTSQGRAFAWTQTSIFHGKGRSYGDVALNANGALYLTAAADSVLAFDRTKGIIRAQSGLTLEALNQLTVPIGWIVPAFPGTQFVTLGGAVANDVHGKNHHHVGSFGAHVRALQLVRSNGDRLVCDRARNSELFAATISGLGLTGFIDWVELQLMPIASANMLAENIPFKNLETFFTLSADSHDWPFSVAWVDCFSRASNLGSGILSRAKFLDDGKLTLERQKQRIALPMSAPSYLLNRVSVSAFNQLYKIRPAARFKGVLDFRRFCFPLDHIEGWNKLYGRDGFYQHQSIIPLEHAYQGVSELLKTIKRRGLGSFLAVLKIHGKETSPGLNTFSMAGASLAMDFPNRGAKTRDLMAELDDITVRYGGRIYPAKDNSMSAETYQTGYPNWERLEALRDPKLMSSFWRRVTNKREMPHEP